MIPTLGSLVILESPYSGDEELNLEYAREAMRDSLSRGEYPLASHLLYAASGVLDDKDEEQRILGMKAGFHWGRHARATVVYTDLGMSRGMQFGIMVAEFCDRPVIYRGIPSWRAAHEKKQEEEKAE